MTEQRRWTWDDYLVDPATGMLALPLHTPGPAAVGGTLDTEFGPVTCVVKYVGIATAEYFWQHPEHPDEPVGINPRVPVKTVHGFQFAVGYQWAIRGDERYSVLIDARHEQPYRPRPSWASTRFETASPDLSVVDRGLHYLWFAGHPDRVPPFRHHVIRTNPDGPPVVREITDPSVTRACGIRTIGLDWPTGVLRAGEPEDDLLTQMIFDRR